MYGYGNYPTSYVNPYQQQMIQNRLNQMEQQQYGNGNTYQPVYQQAQQQTQMLKGRPVSSYDEAKASMIDLDGSMYVFTDLANKKIYTKQIMLDGTADLKTYVLEPVTNVVEPKQNNGYVSVDQFNRVIQELKNKISILEGGAEDVTTDDVTNV